MSSNAPQNAGSPTPPARFRFSGLRIFQILIAVGVGLALIYPACAPAHYSPKKLAHVSHPDPALQAAVRQAQAQLDSFIAELSHPKPNERFAIVGAFATDRGNEYLWLSDVTYQSGTFQGTMAEAPIAYTGAKKGDLVAIRRADVYDWAIKDGDQVRGRFTSKILGG